METGSSAIITFGFRTIARAMATRCRGLESGDEPARSRLSATALPDEPQDLAPLEAEIDSVHGLHIDYVSPKRSKKSGPEFEVLSQPFDPDDLAVLCDRDARCFEDRGGRP